jgi:hypothetical protein
MFKETPSTTESMPPPIATAIAHDNCPSIEDSDAAATVSANMLSDAVESMTSIPAVAQAATSTGGPIRVSHGGNGSYSPDPEAGRPTTRSSALKKIDPAKLARRRETFLQRYIEEIARGVEPTNEESHDESLRSEMIERLWSSKKAQGTHASHHQKAAGRLRSELTKQLYTYKQLLFGTGRDGMWAPFLRERRIPLATADRYVRARERELASPEKLLTEELLDVSCDQIAAIVNRLKPKLLAQLKTTASVHAFLAELTAALQPPEST